MTTCADKNRWIASDIIVPVTTTLENNELVDIDISNTIGKVSRFVGDVNDLTCDFLDREEFSMNDDNTWKNTVISTFAMACHKAGFTCISRGWVKGHCNKSRRHDAPLVHNYDPLPALVVWMMDEQRQMNLYCVNERTRRMTTDDLERDLRRGRCFYSVSTSHGMWYSIGPTAGTYFT